MKRSLSDSAWYAWGSLFMVIVIVIGLWAGWFDLQGRPIEKIQELQDPAEVRNQQIEDLANP